MRRAEVHLAVYRFDHSVYYLRINREACVLISILQRGQTLGEAMEAAFAGSRLTAGEQVTKIQRYFAHAAELGWFCHPPRKECTQQASPPILAIAKSPDEKS